MRRVRNSPCSRPTQGGRSATVRARPPSRAASEDGQALGLALDVLDLVARDWRPAPRRGRSPLAGRHHDQPARQPLRLSELLQRCRSRVRTALAIDVMRFGLHRDLRKIRQDFRRATPRSTGARAAARARLTVFSVRVRRCSNTSRRRPRSGTPSGFSCPLWAGWIHLRARCLWKAVGMALDGEPQRRSGGRERAGGGAAGPAEYVVPLRGRRRVVPQRHRLRLRPSRALP